MTPTIKYTRPPIDSRILDALLGRLYHIVTLSKEMEDADCSDVRSNCFHKIDDTIVSLCAVLTMIEADVQRMDKQIMSLSACVKQQATQSLN